MAKQFKDFIFNNKRLTDMLDCISVDFNSDSDTFLAMERDMEKGEVNHYRVEPNYYGDTWSDTLKFELDIIKNICTYPEQKDSFFTQDEIRTFTKWLTSPHQPLWLHFEYEENNNNVPYYFGWFNNIESFSVGDKVYGLKLHFTCTTPFGYTDIITNTKSVTTYNNMLISNNSDELEDYCYPKIQIHPKSNGQIYICNLSDCNLLANGIVELTQSTYFDSMLDIIDNYALLHNYTVVYTGTGEFNIIPLCNETAIQFYFIDKYGKEIKCTAFYLIDTKEYKIIENGFMFMNVKTNLDVYIDCQKLLITDSIGRMITYDELGISDVDFIYWLRLINGNNSFLLYGNADFIISHRESRKAGE